ncbi:hypothetical protein [Aeromonas caviae]|uniref:hypothetical protein n=1 Tax=Aeromonas caviae TaxID=648 RepID=UPI000A4E1292
MAQILEVNVARHELGERVDHGDDGLAEILIGHAGGTPEGAGPAMLRPWVVVADLNFGIVSTP